MAYEPTNWKSGDVVTSAKLNKMESGITAATPYIVNMLWNEETEKSYLDKTATEIIAAMQKGLVLVINIADGYVGAWPMVNAWMDDTDNAFTVFDQDQPLKFVAASADDYPVQTS